MELKKNIEVAVLNEISKAIVQERNVPDLLNAVLKILYREMGILRGVFHLTRDGILCVEASLGLIKDEIEHGSCRLGEGTIGRTALTGETVMIPEMSSTLDFTGIGVIRKKDRNAVCLCVPLIHHEQIPGTLSVLLKKDKKGDLREAQSLLKNIAAIIAEAVDSWSRDSEEKEKLQAENLRLREELDSAPRPVNIIGNCSAMRSVYNQIAQVAGSNATVLIRGASGTGKELVAKAIFQASPRKGRPFVAVNCAALPDNLIESELFGHEKGAFTGAISSRMGRAEAADGGTLFLDEIGDLSLPVQVKLLRFIQERTFSRVGSNDEIKVDVRIITATSRDLEKLMEEGKFREDLYYRLNVFPIHLPALYKRRSDIMLLAEFFLDKFNRLHGKSIKRISTPAINMLMSYHWPGNVRELENCMERAVLTASAEVLHGYDLPPSLQTGEASGTAFLPSTEQKADFVTLVSSFERELIVDALKAARGNVAAAARRLGLSQRIIHYKINKLGITPEWYKQK